MDLARWPTPQSDDAWWLRIRVNQQDGTGDWTDTAPQFTGPPDIGRIGATVRGGVATLADTVRSLAEGQAVIAAARAIPGLHQIDNRLRINPNG